MRFFSIALIGLVLTSCTLAIGNVQTGKFTIIDNHPGGEALVLSAEITGKAKLEVNRSTQDSTPAIDAVIPLL